MSKRKTQLTKARQVLSTKRRVNIKLSPLEAASSRSTGVLRVANAEERPRDIGTLEEQPQDADDIELSPEELSLDDETRSDSSDEFDDDESSTNGDDSDDDDSGNDDSSDDESEDGESDLEQIADETEIDATINRPGTLLKLEWRRGAGESLKRPYGSGSESTTKRRRRHQREMERAASNTANIVDLFKRQHGLRIPVKQTGSHKSTRHSRLRKLNSALEDLERLIKSNKAQVRTYGHVIAPGGDFDRRHRMVKASSTGRRTKTDAGARWRWRSQKPLGVVCIRQEKLSDGRMSGCFIEGFRKAGQGNIELVRACWTMKGFFVLFKILQKHKEKVHAI